MTEGVRMEAESNAALSTMKKHVRGIFLFFLATMAVDAVVLTQVKPRLLAEESKSLPVPIAIITLGTLAAVYALHHGDRRAEMRQWNESAARNDGRRFREQFDDATAEDAGGREQDPLLDAAYAEMRTRYEELLRQPRDPS